MPPQLDEVDEARKVVNRVYDILQAGGITVYKFHDDTSHDQNTNLHTITNWHNSKTRTLDVSVHFNATAGAHGVEVLYVTQEDLARKVSAAISAAGHLTDRGPKYRSDLFVLNNTDEPAILIETCFCDTTSDCNLYREHYEAICHAIAETITGKSFGDTPPPIDVPTPPERPPVEGSHPIIGKGDTGPDVVYLQNVLGVLEADGDFGSITDIWVRGFQSTCGLAADGIVGTQTWAEVSALETSVAEGEPRLPKALADQIYSLAMSSEIADYAWPGRGLPPPGYIAGMAQAYAYAVLRYDTHDPAVAVMAHAAGDPDEDALAWYASEFARYDMDNSRPGLATMRHLFVMMIGLGPRESSGRYCEGRDLSASNITSDTCEAGLFQTSWNIKSGHPSIGPLLDDFWTNPNGLLPIFKDGVKAYADNLNCYGSGDGIKYQWLSRFAPLFHCLVTGVGMRVLRAHWGPIERREVAINPDADVLLKAVQDLVEGVGAVA